MQVQPYLIFANGNCEEAVEFYKRAIDAKVDMLMRFKDAPDPPPEGCIAPGYGEKVMHTSFRVGDTMIMASDGGGLEKGGFDGFSLSLALTDKAQADRYFDALAEGGSVTMPLGETFWSPRFGMLKDRFGVAWMVNVIPEDPGCAS
jgi:PhnB protein